MSTPIIYGDYTSKKDDEYAIDMREKGNIMFKAKKFVKALMLYNVSIGRFLKLPHHIICHLISIHSLCKNKKRRCIILWQPQCRLFRVQNVQGMSDEH